MSYQEPNYTQTPNQFFDETLLLIDSMSELKVVLAVIRQTFGWHKQEDRISLTRFQQLTGLSRQGVVDGVRAAERHGIIVGRHVGQNIFYRLLVNVVDQSTEQTSEADNQSTALTSKAPKVVNAVDPQKKQKDKERTENKINRFLTGKYADDIQH